MLDVLRFLGRGEARVGPRTRLFVGMSGSYLAGVVADAIVGLRPVPLTDVLPPPLGGDESAEHLLGVVRREPAKETLHLLDLSKLLQAARERAVAP